MGTYLRGDPLAFGLKHMKVRNFGRWRRWPGYCGEDNNHGKDDFRRPSAIALVS